MVKKKEAEDWIQKKWRPMMAVMYMVVCIFDFILFPIGFTIVQFWENQAANDAFRQWQPLTLVGAGLFHMAMGAVLGITAWSRGQEKLAGVSVPMSSSMMPMSSSMMPMSSSMMPVSNSNSYNNYGSSTFTSSERTFVSKQGNFGPVIEEPEI